jgi:hypothetical protein
MNRLIGSALLTPMLAVGFANVASAQSSENGPGGLNDFGLNGLLFFPDEPRDFLTVVDWIVYGYSAPFADPYEINNLNLTFDDTDDQSDPVSLQEPQS